MTDLSFALADPEYDSTVPGALPTHEQGGILPSTFGETRAALDQSEQGSNQQAMYEQQVSANADLVQKLSGQELYMQPDFQQAYLAAKTNPEAMTPAQRNYLDTYTNTINDLKTQYPGQPLRTPDELYADAVAQGKSLQAQAAPVLAGSSLTQRIGGGLVNSFTDPSQLLLLMALAPIGLESATAGALGKIAQTALEQGAVMGGMEAGNRSADRTFNIQQGVDPTAYDENTRQSIALQTLAGMVMGGGGHAVAEAFTPAAHVAAIDEVLKGKVGSDATADLENARTAYQYEAKNPFPPSPDSNRAFASGLDDISSQIENGTFDPSASTALTREVAPIAFRDQAPFQLDDKTLAELGLPPGGKVSPDEVNVSLQSRLAHGMVESAQDDADAASLRANQAANDVADFTEQRDALHAEIAKDTPSAQALAEGGLDQNTANALSAIEDQLGGKMTNRARASLMAQRDSIVASSRPDIDAAKATMTDNANRLDQQVKASSRDLNAAQRAKVQHDNEVVQLQKTADQTDRQLENLRSARDTPNQERLGVSQGVSPGEQPEIHPSVLDAIRDSRAEQRRPMTDAEVKTKVADADAVSPGGDLEESVIREYRDALDQNDLVMRKATGEFNDRGEAIYAPSSARDELKAMDDDEAAIHEILSCLASGG